MNSRVSRPQNGSVVATLALVLGASTACSAEPKATQRKCGHINSPLSATARPRGGFAVGCQFIRTSASPRTRSRERSLPPS
jgi:hypothetical protein